MMDTAAAPSYAIEIDDLVKEFALSHAGFGRLKTQMLAKLRRRDWRRGQSGIEHRRVLDGITLRIGHGETVGLIGRNGSGKSTLLGLLSRIYKPTRGRIAIHGRMIGLLELGAGLPPGTDRDRKRVF